MHICLKALKIISKSERKVFKSKKVGCTSLLGNEKRMSDVKVTGTKILGAAKSVRAKI